MAMISIAFVTAASAGEMLDMRKCPLDTVVFLDPWAGETFAVKRVGTNYVYRCEGGLKKTPPLMMIASVFSVNWCWSVT